MEEFNFAPAVDMIEHFEGCVLHAYRDSVGVLTIGFGTTGPEVHPGMVITKEQAVQMMMADIEKCAAKIKEMVHVPLLNGEMCALISFSYNVGLGGLQGSTLLRELNAGQPKQVVANEFMKWIHAGGQVLSGLVKRRKAERELFLSDHAVMELPA